METSCGLKFVLHDKDYINNLDGYDKTVAVCHVANCGKVITYESGEPIDNEFDLEEIYNLIN